MAVMNWKDNLKYKYRLAGITEKLIAINLLVFVLFILLRTFAFLFQADEGLNWLREWLIVPSRLERFIQRPWTLITYAFMHASFWHILGNMIILYFSGRFFLTYFQPKRMLNYYFLGAIAGAVFFLASYNLFPAFADGRNYHLIGASAAVMAILIGIATQAPNMSIRLFFLGNIKLWWIAAFFVAKDLIYIPIDNPGGHIAHLGGAGLGYLYTTQLARGRDIGGWFERFMDWVVGLFSAKPKKPFKKVYKNKTKPSGKRGPYQNVSPSDYTESQREKQQKIDAILDKISKNGYDSLSKEEKEYLFNAGKD